MEVYIYFGLEQEVDIDDLEEEIEALLGDKGEVIGRGIGNTGGNIDIELYDETIVDGFLGELCELEFPDDTYFVIDGVRKKLFWDDEIQ